MGSCKSIEEGCFQDPAQEGEAVGEHRLHTAKKRPHPDDLPTMGQRKQQCGVLRTEGSHRPRRGSLPVLDTGNKTSRCRRGSLPVVPPRVYAEFVWREGLDTGDRRQFDFAQRLRKAEHARKVAQARASAQHHIDRLRQHHIDVNDSGGYVVTINRLTASECDF